MSQEAPIFEETYNNYLSRIAGINLEVVAARLGAKMEAGQAVIPLLGRFYRVSKEGITREDGRRPQLGTRVILSKYLLMCPAEEPGSNDWAAYRDFKDSGPLTTYFANDVEGAVANAFAGRTEDLEKAAELLGGYVPETAFPYDVCRCFNALPRVPLLMLFNDVDEEFPARCTVLFQAGAEEYLDGECLAMLGAQLSGRLVSVLKSFSE